MRVRLAFYIFQNLIDQSDILILKSCSSSISALYRNFLRVAVLFLSSVCRDGSLRIFLMNSFSMRNVQIFQLRNQTESSQISVLEFISTLALASRTLIFYINWALSAGGHKVVRAHTVEKIVRSRTRAAITRMLLMRGDLSYPSIIFFHELVRFDFSSLVNVICHYVTESLFLRN